MADINTDQLLSKEAPKIIDTMRDALLLLDESLHIAFANASFYSTFKVTPEDTLGKYVYDLGNGQWNIPELKTFIEGTLSREREFHDYKVRHVFPDIGEKTMLLNGKKVKADGDLTLLIISDITDRETAFATLEENLKTIKKLNGFMVGREIKMVELKAEIAALQKSLSEALEKRPAV